MVAFSKGTPTKRGAQHQRAMNWAILWGLLSIFAFSSLNFAINNNDVCFLWVYHPCPRTPILHRFAFSAEESDDWFFPVYGMTCLDKVVILNWGSSFFPIYCWTEIHLKSPRNSIPLGGGKYRWPIGLICSTWAGGFFFFWLRHQWFLDSFGQNTANSQLVVL